MDQNRRRLSAIRLVDLSSEFEDRLQIRRYTVLRPGQIVELGNSASLIGFGVFQVEWANHVVLWPDVLTNQVDFKDSKSLGSFVRPVALVLQSVLLVTQVNNQCDALFPDAVPEVVDSRLKWSLSGNISDLAQIGVVDLWRIDVAITGRDVDNSFVV